MQSQPNFRFSRGDSVSDQLPNDVEIIEQGHRPVQLALEGCGRVDAKVVVERGEHVVDLDRTILGIASRSVEPMI